MENNHLKTMEKSVSFTGHRPQKLGGYNEKNPIALKVKQALKVEILKLIHEGYETFICGGALGVDQWAAEIIISLKDQYPHLHLVIAKPFPSQASTWPQNSQDRFFKQLAKADKVVEVCADPYAGWKMQKRNEYMVNHSKIVVAVWDGTSGGTANAVAYAQKQGREIRQINPLK